MLRRRMGLSFVTVRRLSQRFIQGPGGRASFPPGTMMSGYATAEITSLSMYFTASVH